MDDLIAYLNGDFLPLSQAKISVLDRGFLFGDGVYEVIYFHAGKPIAMEDHVQRLNRSLNELGITHPTDNLVQITEKLIAQNKLEHAKIYWQITRGVGTSREHVPTPDLKPTVMVATWPLAKRDIATGPESIKCTLVPDLRWHRCDIKSIMLVPNCLAKQRASQMGFDEAILHREQTVTEGTSTCLFMAKDGVLQTHPADQWVLPSITRKQIIQMANELEIAVKLEPFTIEQMLDADELFMGSTTSIVANVRQVDEHIIGNGQVGPIATAFFKWFFA